MAPWAQFLRIVGLITMGSCILAGALVINKIPRDGIHRLEILFAIAFVLTFVANAVVVFKTYRRRKERSQ